MLKVKPRKTVDDYMNLPEGVLAELIEGEIFRTPSPAFEHQDVSGEIFFSLRSYVAERNAGKVVVAPMDVHLPTGDVVRPDVILIKQARLGIIQRWIMGAPDLVVEIVSPDRPERDLVLKRDLYARSGIGEYWIVTPETRSVEVLVLRDGRWDSHGYFEAADTMTSPSLAGFSLPLATIFPKP